MEKAQGVLVKSACPMVTILTAELHWYEAHGIGKKEVKIKRVVGVKHERE